MYYLNAPMSSSQLEQLEAFVANNRELAAQYAAHFSGSDLRFVTKLEACRSYYRINALVCDNREQPGLLKSTNDYGVLTRPIWALMNLLSAYALCCQGPLNLAEWLETRVVNLSSCMFTAFGGIAPYASRLI